jgi:hypothetical protein
MYKILMFAFLFLHCTARDKTWHIPVPQPKSLVFLHDISWTFKSSMQPNRSLLTALGREIASGGGVLAFGVIGSPDSTGQLIRCSFAAAPVLPPDPVYSETIAYKNSLATVNHINDSLLLAFVDSCMVLLQADSMGHAWTDVNKGLERAQAFFSELKMGRYHKILVLNTDGKQDVLLPGGGRDHNLHLELIAPGESVITCGWAMPMRIPGALPVESPDGLIDQIRLLTLK